MRVAVLFFADTSRDRVRDISRALAEGVESQGHDVDLIDGVQDVNTKLTIYTHILIVAEQRTLFSGRIPDAIPEFIGTSGVVAGKKSFAFVVKKPLGNTKALKRLMDVMEHEGMFIRYSDVLATVEDSRLIGGKLTVVQ
ncbi:MAG: hypothetical protein ACOC28_00620 [Alkalispirochaetaceae bacterium]